MRAVIYDVATGKIHRCIQAKYIDASLVPAGGWMIEGWADIAKQKVDTTAPDPANHFVIDDPAYLEPQSYIDRSIITARRKELEEYPITVTHESTDYTLDYDSVSRERVRYNIDYWDSITDTHTTIESVEYLKWVDANNSEQLFTEADFIAIQLLLETEYAARLGRLHAHAVTLIDSIPSVTREDMLESNWPMTAP